MTVHNFPANRKGIALYSLFIFVYAIFFYYIISVFASYGFDINYIISSRRGVGALLASAFFGYCIAIFVLSFILTRYDLRIGDKWIVVPGIFSILILYRPWLSFIKIDGKDVVVKYSLFGFTFSPRISADFFRLKAAHLKKLIFDDT